ncbi:MAG: hypothetical protein WAM82_01695 [Thermoanaerobaculia bacterium]
MLVNSQYVVLFKRLPDLFKIRPGDMLWLRFLRGREASIGVQECDQRTRSGLQFGHSSFDVLVPLLRIEDASPDFDVDADHLPEATDALEIREMSPNFLGEAKRLLHIPDYQLHLLAIS